MKTLVLLALILCLSGCAHQDETETITLTPEESLRLAEALKPIIMLFETIQMVEAHECDLCEPNSKRAR